MQKSIFRNAIYKSILGIFNIVVPILIGPYTYRILGPEIIGQIGFVETIYFYFYIFATFGIYQYGLRELSRIKEDREGISKLFSGLFLLGVISNIVVTAIYIVFIKFSYGGNEAFPVFIIYTINIMSSIFYVEWANEALEKYDFITLKTIAVKLVYLILLFTLIKSSKDYLTYVIIAAFCTLMNYLISFFYITKEIKITFKGLTIVPHIKYLVMSIIMSSAPVFYVLLDRFVLGQFLDKTSVSFYIASQSIMTIVNTLVLSVILVTIPRL